MKAIVAILVVLTVCLALAACSSVNNVSESSERVISDESYENEYAVPEMPVQAAEPRIPSSVRAISDGNEHAALEHWHHSFSGNTSASGSSRRPEDVADQLIPFVFNDDFQIIIEGPLHGGPTYYFHRLNGDEWITALAVFKRHDRHVHSLDWCFELGVYRRHDPERIFVTHGRPRGEWDEVYVESFLDLLEPGEYILEVNLWWGSSRAASAYQNFFRFIK
ncbi:MAG: hypothetical protein FWB75_07985 [Oscillospiraceae bacterium]|nr:hypothetical protein [Oscillospiraceae bacterium]